MVRKLKRVFSLSSWSCFVCFVLSVCLELRIFSSFVWKCPPVRSHIFWKSLAKSRYFTRMFTWAVIRNLRLATMQKRNGKRPLDGWWNRWIALDGLWNCNIYWHRYLIILGVLPSLLTPTLLETLGPLKSSTRSLNKQSLILHPMYIMFVPKPGIFIFIFSWLLLGTGVPILVQQHSNANSNFHQQ